MAVLVESCFRLDTRLLRSDLQKARWHEPVDGFLNFKTEGRESVLDYEMEYLEDKTYLVIMYGSEPQRILLSERELTFGKQTYLTCACERRTTALYLKNGRFACLQCHKLHYESASFNRYSKFGKVMTQHRQVMRVIDMKEKMTRPRWRSRYTKRYLYWMAQAIKAGLFNDLIKAMERGAKTEKNYWYPSRSQ